MNNKGLYISEDLLDEILFAEPTDPNELNHSVKNESDTIFTWDYSVSRQKLRKLYLKGLRSQWNPEEDINWKIDVDIEKSVILDQGPINKDKFIGTPLEKWKEKEWLEYSIQSRKYNVSQFLHGEQGALMFASKTVQNIPWFDAKLYASSQVLDEAKHLDVFSRYLNDKLGGGYTVNTNFKNYMSNIINDPRWDFTYLGGQVIGEGLSLSSFGYLYQITKEPLIKQILDYIIKDESRHVAFGVISLTEVYENMNDLEIKERQEFAYEASFGLMGKLVQHEVWDYMGVDSKIITPLVINSGKNRFMRQAVFTKVVPNCKKLGLLDRNNGWLRKKFEEMGVIQFEDMELTDEEI
jgi:hypothetical protein